jgi:hypothetical protein
MDIDHLDSLEKALAKTEADADAALKASTAAVSSIKKFRTAAQTGNLRELRKTIEAAEQAITTLRQQFTNAKEDWVFDEEAYLSGRYFISEILETAKQIGLEISERDNILYCYPFLIRILPGERSIRIDKMWERRLRPSVLAKHLKDRQSKPSRFKPEAFLESLFSAYEIVVAPRGKELSNTGIVIKLRDIYDLLTLLPGQSKEYSTQEFARDIYLLDLSQVTRTKKGLIVAFHFNRPQAGTITVIGKNGDVKKYFGISFANE